MNLIGSIVLCRVAWSVDEKEASRCKYVTCELKCYVSPHEGWRGVN